MTRRTFLDRLAIRLFQGIGLTRTDRNAKIETASVHWNYTTVLNIVFVVVAAVFVWRFVRTGGLPMLRMMNGPIEPHAHETHAHPHPHPE